MSQIIRLASYFWFSFMPLAFQDCELSQAKIFEPKQIPIIALSQNNIHHARRADIFKQHIQDQLKNSNITSVRVYLLHENWYHVGSWTILSILPDIARQFPDAAAILFCEEETRINIDLLYNNLGKFDYSKELFLGHGLRDKEATIIHHFAFHENPSSFVYPDFAAGVVLSLPLIKRIAKKLSESTPPKSDFAIDAKHELAMYIWNHADHLRMKDTKFLCTNPADDCATTKPTIFPNCGKVVSENDVLFAVKTCEKFHQDRVPVVKDTWGKDAKNIEYYSETADESIPTVDLGVPNTESGHCGKTMAILKHFRKSKKFADMKWLVIADDDTLLRVPRLYQLLACYNEEEPIALGERYGYGVLDESGYNYITGGGGMVFSRPAVKMIVDLGMCQCGSNDAPDDMILGMCLKRMGILITHSPYFHQARPMDYSRSYLDHLVPVSFHKHWMIDPRKVYHDWLDESSHDEL